MRRRGVASAGRVGNSLGLCLLTLVFLHGFSSAASYASTLPHRISFETPVVFGVSGTNPDSVAFGDFNLDGNLDVVTANRTSDNVSLLVGDGTGDFPSTSTFSTGGSSPRAVATADFDRNGALDVAVANYVSSDVSLLLGNGSGGFSTHITTIHITPPPRDVEARDVNRDGKPDVVLALEDGTVAPLLGDGYGNLIAYPRPLPVHLNMTSPLITLADLNRDGIDDLVGIRDASPSHAQVCLGAGDGSFSPGTDYQSGYLARKSLTTADVNADGKLDLALPNESTPTAAVMLGNGSGALAFPAMPPTRCYRSATIAASDLDNDGKIDLLPTGRSTSSPSAPGIASALDGNGLGGFSLTETFSVCATSPADSLLADFDHDGRKDLITANGALHSVSMLRNSSTVARRMALEAPSDVSVDASRPEAIASADFNRDGQGDIASANRYSGNVTVLLARSPRSYYRWGRYAVGGTAPLAMIAADLNRDGKPDLATANSGSDDVSVMYGTGTGGVIGTGPFDTGQWGRGPDAITCADFNRDGYPDLAVANGSTSNVSILLQSNPGIFTPSHYPPFGIGTGAWGLAGIAAADFDSDGKIDVATANSGSDNVSIFKGDGTGHLLYFTQVAAGALCPGGIVAADFNHDGDCDLATANGGGDSISLFRGYGTTAFTLEGTIPVPLSSTPRPAALSAADFDNDGRLDLAVSGYNGTAVMRGNGDLGFALESVTRIAAGSQSIVAADLDRDGKCDLATGDPEGDKVSLLFSDTTAPTTGLDVFPPTPDGEDGWYRNRPSTELRANDAARVLHQLDSTSTERWLDHPSTVIGDGIHTLYWYAVDSAENTEIVRSRVFKVDTQPPAGTMVINHNESLTAVREVTVNSNVVGASMVRFRLDDSGTWSSWSAYARDKAVTLSAGDGLKTVHAEYKDIAGNVSAPPFDTITLDMEAPAGTMSINDGAASTSSRYAWVRAIVTDAAEARFDSGTGWSMWHPSQSLYPVELTDVDGEKTVAGEFRDEAGNVLSVSDTIVLDTTAPSVEMVIDRNAEYTTTLSVTAHCAADDATQMRFREGPEWSAWEAFGTTKALSLSHGDGPKTIYAEFKDAAENVSATSDTIELDTVPPSGTMQVNDGAASTQCDWVWVASSVNAAARMRFDAGAGWTEWEPYAEQAYDIQLSPPDGDKTVRAQYRDRAGNIRELEDSIVFDTAAPSGTMVVNEGLYGTRSTTIPVALNVAGATSMTFYVAGAWTDPRAYGNEATLTLPPGDGYKYIWANFHDTAGNCFGAGADVVLDTQAPDVQSLAIEDGRPYTRSRGVQVTSDARESGIEARFDAGGGWTPWQTDNVDAYLTLPPGDGTKTVRGEYRDWVGNAKSLSDTITLDTVEPAKPGSFRAIGRDPGDDRISLFWTNPPDAAFSHELIFCSMSGYAGSWEDPDQRLLRHTGRTSLDDTGSAWVEGDFRRGTRYYYTMYAFDRAGNWSLPATSTAVMRYRTQLTANGPFSWSGWKGTYGEAATVSGEMFLPEVLDDVDMPTEIRSRKDISLWKRQYGEAAWSRVTAATYKSTYDWYEARTPVIRTTLFQFRFSGDTTYAPSTSPAVAVKAHAYLSQPWTAPTTISRGRYFLTYGYLKPRHSGTTRLDFHRYVYGKWRHYTLRNAVNYNYSTLTRYRLSYRLPYRGRWYVRAEHSDSDHLTTLSPIRYFTVR